jgi:hypothetical protein
MLSVEHSLGDRTTLSSQVSVYDHGKHSMRGALGQRCRDAGSNGETKAVWIKRLLGNRKEPGRRPGRQRRECRRELLPSDDRGNMVEIYGSEEEHCEDAAPKKEAEQFSPWFLGDCPRIGKAGSYRFGKNGRSRCT